MAREKPSPESSPTVGFSLVWVNYVRAGTYAERNGPDTGHRGRTAPRVDPPVVGQEGRKAEIAATVWARVGWSVGGSVLEPRLRGASPGVPVQLWAGSFVIGARWRAGWQLLLERRSHIPSLFVLDSSPTLSPHSHSWIPQPFPPLC